MISRTYFFTLPATLGAHTLSLHDALPILSSRRAGASSFAGMYAGRTVKPCSSQCAMVSEGAVPRGDFGDVMQGPPFARSRSEEHTSELQSLRHLVCRLLLEKKKKQHNTEQ